MKYDGQKWIKKVNLNTLNLPVGWLDAKKLLEPIVCAMLGGGCVKIVL